MPISMVNTFQGDMNDAANGRYGIVVSRYNESITANLLDGAVATLKSVGVPEHNIDVAWVPGAFEIPLVADTMAGSGKYAAVLCLGAVIKGETTHDQHINRAVSLGITEANLRHKIPVLFGVLTCDTLQQAIQRSTPLVNKSAKSVSEPSPFGRGQGEGTGISKIPPHPNPLPKGEGEVLKSPVPVKLTVSNKGVECAQAALEMVSLLRKLK